MEFFSNLLTSFIGIFQSTNDPIAVMPIEICEMIFRQLDPQSLLNAARVSKKWMDVCKNDSTLRNTARRYLQIQRQKLFNVSNMNKNKNKKFRTKRTTIDKNTFYQRKPMSFNYNPNDVNRTKESLMSIKNNENNCFIEKRLVHRFR